MYAIDSTHIVIPCSQSVHREAKQNILRSGLRCHWFSTDNLDIHYTSQNTKANDDFLGNEKNATKRDHIDEFSREDDHSRFNDGSPHIHFLNIDYLRATHHRNNQTRPSLLLVLL